MYYRMLQLAEAGASGSPLLTYMYLESCGTAILYLRELVSTMPPKSRQACIAYLWVSIEHL